MKRVLVVSDDTDFHAFLSETCALPGVFQMVSARDGWEAMAEQRLRPADLALLDFNAASWDAYQLLGRIHADFPGLPIIGLTRTPEVMVERRMRHAGAVRMLNREAHPEALLDELIAMLEAPPKGHVEGIHLASLLQVLHWERKNCVVRVNAQERKGLLRFERGLLVHARWDHQSGEAAALAILSWEDTKVDFLPDRSTEKSIHKPLDEILMLAAQARDEFPLDGGGSGPAPGEDPFSGDNLTFQDVTPA